MRLRKQVEFLGVTLRLLPTAFIRKGSDVWRKDGITVLRNSKGAFFTTAKNAFKPYNEYFHPLLAEGLLALGGVKAATVKEWKSKEDERVHLRIEKDSTENLVQALRELKMKPSAEQAKLIKKHGLK